MKKKYYVTEKTTLQDLLGFSFRIERAYLFAYHASRNLYITLDQSNGSYEPRRIYHNDDNQMVKASEIADMISAGVVKL
jgi:hypothetical protein